MKVGLACLLATDVRADVIYSTVMKENPGHTHAGFPCGPPVLGLLLQRQSSSFGVKEEAAAMQTGKPCIAARCIRSVLSLSHSLEGVAPLSVCSALISFVHVHSFFKKIYKGSFKRWVFFSPSFHFILDISARWSISFPRSTWCQCKCNTGLPPLSPAVWFPGSTWGATLSAGRWTSLASCSSSSCRALRMQGC